MKRRKTANRLKLILSLTLVVALFISGCTFLKKAAEPSPSDYTNVIYDTGFKEIWEAVQVVAKGESLPMNLVDEDIGVIETQKSLEFNKQKLYRQYVTLYSEIKSLSPNFTSVSVSYSITRYDPVTHIWRPVAGLSREKNFLNKVKAFLEAG